MQKIRGFVYFEGKTFDEVNSSFTNFHLDNVELGFFRSLFRYNKNILESGVFIDGNVDDKYSSKDIVNLFRKQVDLEEKLRGCDVSIESEDALEIVKKGDLKGNYIGIRIKPPYQLEQIKDLAYQIGEPTNASNIFVRTVESENENPLVCIDLIIQNSYENHKQQVEQLITDNKFTLGKYSYMKLE